MDMKRDAADQPPKGPEAETERPGGAAAVDAAIVAALLRERPTSILEQLTRELETRREVEAAQSPDNVELARLNDELAETHRQGLELVAQSQGDVAKAEQALEAMRARHANALAEVAAAEVALSSAVHQVSLDRCTANEAAAQARNRVQALLWQTQQRGRGFLAGELVGGPGMPGVPQWKYSGEGREPSEREFVNVTTVRIR